MGLQLQRNGKPYKELVKIAHPPIIRRSDATATCHGEVRHELCRRVLLGFAASGVPGFRRSALLLLAALVKPKSPDWKAKDLGVGKITKSPGKLKPKLQALIPGHP